MFRCNTLRSSKEVVPRTQTRFDFVLATTTDGVLKIISGRKEFHYSAYQFIRNPT
ncbi:hypothetical protein PanWU01x14_093640, partial [Parasponia andersonii]